MIAFIFELFASFWWICFVVCVGVFASVNTIQTKLDDIHYYGSVANGGTFFVSSVCSVFSIFSVIILFGDTLKEYLQGDAFVLKAVLVYLFVGMVFSFVEYRNYVKKCISTVSQINFQFEKYEKMLNNIKPENSKSVIAFFVINWPLMFIANFFSNFSFVWSFISGWVYNKIYNSVIENTKIK